MSRAGPSIITPTTPRILAPSDKLPPHDAASSPGRQLPHSVSAHDDEAHRIAARVCHGGESDRDIARHSPFSKRALGIGHRRRRIHHEHRGHRRAILSQPDVRAIASSEQPPIDALGIVPLTIHPVLAELGSGATEARVVCARECTGNRPKGRPLHAPNRVEKRAARLGPRCVTLRSPLALFFAGRAWFAHVAAARRGFRSPELARDGSRRRRFVRR